MSVELKVTEIGGDLALVIPKGIAEELRIGEGDTLFLTKNPTEFEAPSQEEKIQRQMEVAERVMRENRNLLHKLAQ